MYILEGTLKVETTPNKAMNVVRSRLFTPFFSGRLQIVVEPGDIVLQQDSTYDEWDVIIRLDWRHPHIRNIQAYSFKYLANAISMMESVVLKAGIEGVIKLLPDEG